MSLWRAAWPWFIACGQLPCPTRCNGRLWAWLPAHPARPNQNPSSQARRVLGSGEGDGEDQAAGAERDGEGDEIALKIAHGRYSLFAFGFGWCFGEGRFAPQRLPPSLRTCNITKRLKNQVRNGVYDLHIMQPSGESGQKYCSAAIERRLHDLATSLVTHAAHWTFPQPLS